MTASINSSSADSLSSTASRNAASIFAPSLEKTPTLALARGAAYTPTFPDDVYARLRRRNRALARLRLALRRAVGPVRDAITLIPALPLILAAAWAFTPDPDQPRGAQVLGRQRRYRQIGPSCAGRVARLTGQVRTRAF